MSNNTKENAQTKKQQTMNGLSNYILDLYREMHQI